MSWDNGTTKKCHAMSFKNALHARISEAHQLASPPGVPEAEDVSEEPHAQAPIVATSQDVAEANHAQASFIAAS